MKMCVMVMDVSGDRGKEGRQNVMLDEYFWFVCMRRNGRMSLTQSQFI